MSIARGASFYPTHFVYNSPYLCNGYGILSCKLVLADALAVFFSNISYLIKSKFCHAMKFARLPGSAILFSFIPVIIGNCTKKKMAWFHTSRVVAFVTHTLAFGNMPFVHFIRNSMRFKLFVISYNLPISKCFGASPNPAFFGFLYIFPKSLFKSEYMHHQNILWEVM